MMTYTFRHGKPVAFWTWTNHYKSSRWYPPGLLPSNAGECHPMESVAVAALASELWVRCLAYFFPYMEKDASVVEEQFRRNLHVHGNTFMKYPSHWTEEQIAEEEHEMYPMHCVTSEEKLKDILGPELGEELVQAMTHRCSADCKCCGCPSNANGGCGSLIPCMCRQGFPKPLHFEEAFVDDDGWYITQRFTERDKWLESTSPYLWACMRTHLSFRRQNVLGRNVAYNYAYSSWLDIWVFFCFKLMVTVSQIFCRTLCSWEALLIASYLASR